MASRRQVQAASKGMETVCRNHEQITIRRCEGAAGECLSLYYIAPKPDSRLRRLEKPQHQSSLLCLAGLTTAKITLNARLSSKMLLELLTPAVLTR